MDDFMILRICGTTEPVREPVWDGDREKLRLEQERGGFRDKETVRRNRLWINRRKRK